MLRSPYAEEATFPHFSAHRLNTFRRQKYLMLSIWPLIPCEHVDPYDIHAPFVCAGISPKTLLSDSILAAQFAGRGELEATSC